MDALKGIIAVVVIILVAGGLPIILVNHFRHGKYSRRREAVMEYAQAAGYEFYGRTMNDLDKLEQSAAVHRSDTA